jgi:hypothetical protein
MKPTTTLWCATLIAACASVTTPTKDQEARIAEARALLTESPERAADVAESVLADNPSLREARVVAAEASWELAQRDKGAAVQLHLQDAVANLQKALAGADDRDQPEALLLLARCHEQLGELEEAREVAVRAARALGTLDVIAYREAAARALLIAGNCDLRRFVAARQEELAGGETDSRGIVPYGEQTASLASRAGASFEQAHGALPVEATQQLVVLHRWLGQPVEVLRAFERGLRQVPADQSLHEALFAWADEDGRNDVLPATYARLVREMPSTPVLRWFQGRVQFDHAARQHRDGAFAKAIDAYGRADRAFGEYAAMVSVDAADGADQWRASCRLEAARAALDAGELRTAGERLLAAGDVGGAERFPAETARLVHGVHVAWAQLGGDALANALAFDEQVLRRWPDRWGFAYNNAALTARDLGVQKARSGGDAAARELWERAYAWYETAVRLSPDDERVVNDCGLMLVYHLHRDLDRARACFERAIELGKQKLAALPADTPAADRETIEEAVGDAYQNLAVMTRVELKRPFAEYRAFCEESVKYYPYQRREAAALLRTEGRDDVPSTQRSAGGPSGPQGGAADALAKRRAEIDKKVAAEDFDGALTVLDELAKECKDHAPFQALKGEITLKLAAQARDAGRKNVGLLFEDAVAALKRAVELDPEPIAPRQLLAQAQFDTGDTDAAARTLNGLLLHMQSQGGGKPEDMLAVHALRARAAAIAYQTKKQANADDKELLTAARASFRALEEKGAVDAALLTTWSATEQWAGAPAEAVNVWARALTKAPEDRQLLDALLKTAWDQGQLAVAAEALAKRTDAIGLWYLGEARFWLADAQRTAGKTGDALQTLDGARDAFAASLAKDAAFKNDCEQRIARCLGKKGSIAIAIDDAANAEKWLLESARMRPDELATDLGGNDSTKRSLLLLVDKYMKKNDLAKVEAIARAAAAAAHADVDLQNNAGLFARDLGDQLARRGKTAEAKAMYEQSYQAYGKAVQLDPTNVRLRNDLALIAIHSLERDWEQAKQLLDGAIADGEKTLRDAPPADANDKQQLEEAVGDCYENLALWQLKHGGDAAAAKAAAEQSLKFHPRERRPGARRHLQEAERRLQGK